MPLPAAFVSAQHHATPATSWQDLSQRLRTADLGAVGSACSLALGYDFRDHRYQEMRALHSPEGALIERWPPALEDLGEEVLAVWAALADDGGTPPLLRALLADLMWCGRHDSPEHAAYQLAGIAVEQYTTLVAASTVDEMDRIHAARRIISISRETGAKIDLTPVVAPLCTMARLFLDSGPEELYAVPAVLEVLIAAGYDPAETRALLRDYADHPISQSAEDQRWLVDMWAAFGRRSEGLERTVRAYQLAMEQAEDPWVIAQQARGFCRQHGLTEDLALFARVQQQSSPQMVVLTADVAVSRDEIRDAFDWLLGCEDWPTAFTALADYSFPISDAPRLQDLHWMYRFFTWKMIGPRGTSYEVTPQDRPAHDRVNRTAQNLALFGWLLAEALDDLGDRLGKPQDRDITDWLHARIPSNRVPAASRGLGMWWAGFYDGLAHLIAPRIEPFVRDAAAGHDLQVITDGRGGFSHTTVCTLGRTLGDLLQVQSDPATRALTELLHFALADPRGSNLRNLISHGLRGDDDRLDEYSRGEASVLLYLYLRVAGGGLTATDNPVETEDGRHRSDEQPTSAP